MADIVINGVTYPAVEVISLKDANGDDILFHPAQEVAPTYYYEESARVVQNILAFKAAHPNNLIFGAVSDNHVYANNAQYEAQSKASIRHGAFALETVGAMVGADFVVNLGDNCWENGIDTANAFEGASYVMEKLKPAFSRLTCYAVPGNHDKCDDTQKLFDLVGAVNSFDNYGTTRIRGYGYKDVTSKKLRIICLNCVDYLRASGGYGMSYEQKDWLMRSLDLSGKSDGAQWKILLLSHFPLDFTGGDYNTGADLKTILDSYVAGTTASITVNSSYALNESPSGYPTYSSGKLVYNYSGKNVAKIIANIHGHVHTNAYGNMDGSNILRMSTPNTCFYLNKTESYPDNGDYTISSAEAAKLVKTANTAKDTSVTFYCFDLDKETVTAFGYGANTDRVASYKDAVVYTVSYSLTSVASSNSANKAVEGSSFTTTLTGTGGAIIKTVKVTMGGTDITSTAYKDGVVTISNVTGNIAITATAEVELPYTNLFVPADVKLSTRFNSSGAIVDGSFWTMETYIPVAQGDVIRVYNPNALWNDFPQRAICTYNSSKTYVSGLYVSNCTQSADDHTITYTIPSGVAFIRISGAPYNKADGVILTKNEEIV